MAVMEKGTVDFVFCDTYGYLTDKGKVKQFKTIEERDRYIKRIQDQIKTAYEYLKEGDRSGSMVIGVDAFSMLSLGQDIFGKLAKRVLVWNKDLEVNPLAVRGYADTRAYFMWGLKARNWAYNLEEGENFFTGEFLQSSADGFNKDVLSVSKAMVRRFTNPDDTVVELNPKANSVLRVAIESEGRRYIAGKVLQGELHVREE